MNKKILNIVAVFLIAAFPLSVLGVEFHHHICTTTNAHLVSIYNEVNCGHKKEEKSDCCKQNKLATENISEKSCCSAENNDKIDQADNNPCDNGSAESTINNEDCCVNYTQHFSLEDTFVQQDLNKQNIKTNPDIEYNSIKFSSEQNSTKLFNSSEKPILIFLSQLQSILNYIHHTSSTDSDNCQFLA